MVSVGYNLFLKESTDRFVKAELGEVREEIFVSGKVTSASSVDLSFERTGAVAKNYFKVGDRVKEGDTLIALDQTEILANLNKAKANLQKALVEYNSLKRSSASSYSTGVNGLSESLHKAYIVADDTIRNSADQFYTNPRDNNAYFDPTFTDGGYTYLSNLSPSVKSDLSDQRVAMESLLTKWKAEVENLGSSTEDLNTAYDDSRENLLAVQNFLDKIASAINSITTENFTYRTTINGYKTTISSARSQIIAALSSISDAKNIYSHGPSLESGSYDDVLAEEAYIQSLREDIKGLESELKKTRLTSPIDGVVSLSSIKRGEIVPAGKVIYSVLSEHQKQVEANVSEVKIGRVEVGNPVTISFDAFQDETYEGKVTYVDPAEILIDDIPTYKVTVTFNDEVPERIRSGFTANLNIVTATKSNVVKVPSYVLTRDKGSYSVFIKNKGAVETRTVAIGIRGSDGSVEIKGGIDAGQDILVK